MKLIIDIPDKVYELLKYFEKAMGLADKKEDENDNVKTVLIRAVVNGTPLPKGHGRLKDFDKIEWYGCDFEGRGCIEAKGNCSVCNHANCYAKQVRELPTIIEADKEQEDGN